MTADDLRVAGLLPALPPGPGGKLTGSLYAMQHHPGMAEELFIVQGSSIVQQSISPGSLAWLSASLGSCPCMYAVEACLLGLPGAPLLQTASLCRASHDCATGWLCIAWDTLHPLLVQRAMRSMGSTPAPCSCWRAWQGCQAPARVTRRVTSCHSVTAVLRLCPTAGARVHPRRGCAGGPHLQCGQRVG